jgi:hypothetical protein
VLELWLALGQVPLEPAHRCTLVLRRASLGVEVDERPARPRPTYASASNSA